MSMVDDYLSGWGGRGRRAGRRRRPLRQIGRGRRGNGLSCWVLGVWFGTAPVRQAQGRELSTGSGQATAMRLGVGSPRTGGLLVSIARRTPHRFRPKTPEPASPLGEGEEWCRPHRRTVMRRAVVAIARRTPHRASAEDARIPRRARDRFCLSPRRDLCGTRGMVARKTLTPTLSHRRPLRNPRAVARKTPHPNPLPQERD